MECKNIRKTKEYDFKKSCSKFIIDVDTGCDDAQFIMLMIHLTRKYNKQIIGITCVDGNALLSDVVTNTLITLQICDAKIPVYRGAQNNIIGYISKDNYFGKDGLNNLQEKYDVDLTPEYRNLVQTKKAYVFISQSAETYGKDLGIIATGPLTNIAITYLLDNRVPELIGGFAIMGGNYSGIGLNHAFSAEFNFFGDVDAAYLVIRNFQNIVMIPLELALSAPTYMYDQIFNSEKTKKSRFIKDIFLGKIPALCDPLTAFLLLAPESVTKVYRVYGEVCRDGARTKGYLAIDWLGTSDVNKPNLQIVCDMDWKFVAQEMVNSMSD